MAKRLHTVIETPPFLSMAKSEGMTVAEREAAVSLIAQDPEAGDLIQGSGGVRKVRVSGRGKGKSGGYRVATYYSDGRHPVFLLAVLSKASADNFTDRQVQTMARAVQTLVQSLGPRAAG